MQIQAVRALRSTSPASLLVTFSSRLTAANGGHPLQDCSTTCALTLPLHRDSIQLLPLSPIALQPLLPT